MKVTQKRVTFMNTHKISSRTHAYFVDKQRRLIEIKIE